MGSCVAILAKAQIRSPIALVTTDIMHAIDGAAEVLTGDREALWSKPASTGPEMRAHSSGMRMSEAPGRWDGFTQKEGLSERAS